MKELNVTFIHVHSSSGTEGLIEDSDLLRGLPKDWFGTESNDESVWVSTHDATSDNEFAALMIGNQVATLKPLLMSEPDWSLLTYSRRFDLTLLKSRILGVVEVIRKKSRSLNPVWLWTPERVGFQITPLELIEGRDQGSLDSDEFGPGPYGVRLSKDP